MCGIAGYSVDVDSDVDRTLAAQALLAAIAERGADASGYAWRGRGRHEVFFASTREALEIVEDTLRITLGPREVDEGTLLALSDGRVAWRERFRPDRSYDEKPLPAVRAPHEGASCLR